LELEETSNFSKNSVGRNSNKIAPEDTSKL
jgi:hypothetical protein